MATNAKPKRGVRRLPVMLEVEGQAFPFTLCHRELHLEEIGTVQYYWIDSKKLRDLRDAEGIGNFRSCLGLWWWMTIQRGLNADPIQQDTLLLATSYQLVTHSKSLQHIYLDARLRALKAGSTAREKPEIANALTLPDEDRTRINEIVTSRNRYRIKQEFDQALGLFVEPDNERYWLTWMCETFLARGRELLQARALEGVNVFVDSLGEYLAKWRRRGAADFEHRFIDMLSYECKVCFYLTYANAWRSLIPWLEQHEALDIRSKRFLRVWHWQNQPIDVVPPAGDKYAPTRRRDARVAEPWLDFVPDVFSGQILGLHPLSGIIMKDPALLSLVGRYVESEQFDRVRSTGHADACPAYWDFLELILTSANLYRLAHDQSMERRAPHVSQSVVPELGVAENGPSHLQLLNDMAAALGWRCTCGGGLEILRQPISMNTKVTLEYKCAPCGLTRSFDLDEEQLTKYLSNYLQRS